MRTTLDLDDSVLQVARAIARDAGISIGAAVSQLALRGLRAQVSTTEVDAATAFPKFAPTLDAPPITLEVVNRHRDGD